MILKKYNVYRQWGTELFFQTDDENEAWASLDRLSFGEGYVVKDEHGEVRGEFVPF